jgi:hypothetical protein
MDAQDGKLIDKQASDRMSVAPDPESATNAEHPVGDVREAIDARLDVALDESFPTSDAPSNTQPGKGKDPAPSSGYDEAKERELASRR